jgi:hypothetical protein
MHFKKINNLIGWLIFGVAAAVYLNTLEPTVSFWDCGEFISCAYHLEIGHQPGAPFFLLLGRLFSLFAGHHAGAVAVMINSLSALASAGTIMFLFWTITRLAVKLIPENSMPSGRRTASVFTAGIAGALACTFSDTFWFSAVEGEVYATSALFTAVAFWAILKWEEMADSETGDRWIILIVYLMGLSVGVHLLNLLTIPAIVLVYYFRKYTATLKGTLSAIFISFAILLFVVFVLIPWLIRLAAWTDLLFVNGFGLPFNTGTMFYTGLLAALFIFLLTFSHARHKVLLNKITLALMMFCIGYSSFIVLSIRAAANPPINLSKVKDPFSLLGYITREQYVIRPVVYGPYYNAPVTGYKSTGTYIPAAGKYQRTEQHVRYEYDKRFMTLFPRMGSDDPQDIEAYRRWGKIKGTRLPVIGRDGRSEMIVKPLFTDNLRYFFRYQLGFMYFRYFMWNFAGRQTENQGNGSILNGNWISGIPLLDEARLGPQANYPATLRANKGRNVYYMLPLLLGILGIIFQYRRSRKSFLVVLLLFLLTGVAIVVYLNEVPVTPRERDYAVGGSFYVFCIWIGLGAAGMIEYLRRRISTLPGIIVSLLICAVCIPGLMARENFDDHNRSHRFVARDFAYDYLNSCAPDAILFTNADNDTYPLWYVQEVEGIRTDVRVILAPFLNADWYIGQLADWHGKATPVPLTIDAKKYASGRLNSVPFYKRTDQYAMLKDVIEFISSDDSRAMIKAMDDIDMNYYPTNLFTLPADSAQQAFPGCLQAVDFKLEGSYMVKNDLVILDILATNNWKRPVYFLSTQVPASLGLLDYLQLDGFAYRLVPFKYRAVGFSDAGRINADDLYDKLMNKFAWGHMNDPGVFLDYNIVRTTNILGIRSCFARLADEYIRHGKNEKAIQVLDRCMELMPHEAVPYDIFMLPVISAYFQAGAADKAHQYAGRYKDILQKELAYYSSLTPRQAEGVDYERKYAMYVLEELEKITR